MWFLGLTPSASQTASGSVQPFLHTSRQRPLYFTMRRPFPQNSSPFPWVIWTPSNRPTWFLIGPTRVHNPNCLLIGSAVFIGLAATSLYFTMGCPFPQKLPFKRGSGPNRLRGSSSPPKPTTQTVSSSFQRFLQARSRL